MYDWAVIKLQSPVGQQARTLTWQGMLLGAAQAAAALDTASW